MFQFVRACILFVSMFLIGFTAAGAAETTPALHTVTDGEFLVRIAQEYPNVTWRAIARTNKLKSPYIIRPGDVLVIPTNTARAAQAVQKTVAVVHEAHTVPLKRTTPRMSISSEVVKTANGPAHVLQGMIRNRITAHDAIEQLFDDVTPITRERMRAQVRSGAYTPVLLPVGYRITRMLSSDNTRHENVLIAPLTDTPLLGMCYALSEGDTTTHFLIQEVKSWNWYREIIPIGGLADCTHPRTGLRVNDIAPPLHAQRDEALMPYVAIPHSQARVTHTE